MAERTKIVLIEDHDPRWKTDFLRLRSMVEEYIGDFVIDIQHVGSTAVEGLPAKPVIDIDAVIEDVSILPDIIRRLEGFGYICQGDLGVRDRYAFQRIYVEEVRYNLYVCTRDGVGYTEHIAFRDHLGQNVEARNEYGELKKRLAEAHRADVDAYCEGKTPFIDRILRSCGVR